MPKEVSKNGFKWSAAVVAISLFIGWICFGTVSAGTSQEGRSYEEGEEPHILPVLEVDPDTIGSLNSGYSQRNATVTLRLEGRGDPAVIFDPQDTVFVMDCSDSMKGSDPMDDRIKGVKQYLENMLPPDRAVIVSIRSEAHLVNGHHLSQDYQAIERDLEDISPSGGTNLKDGVALANKELLENGEPGKIWMEILLTDAKPDDEANITEETLQEAEENNITIYTIGLGDEQDSDLLRYIARRTGGEYYSADDPSLLVEIYESISNKYKNFTAGMDTDITDSEPMVRLVVPDVIRIDNYSFEPEPDFIGYRESGGTILEWNVTALELGEVWVATFNVSASSGGELQISVYPGSRLKYTRYDGTEKTVKIESVSLKIKTGSIPPPPPPPPAPLPISLPPAPPPPSVPVISPTTNVIPTVTAQTNVVVTPTLQPAAIPVQYILAGLAGLGIAERTRLKKKLVQKHKVTVGA